MKIYFEYDPSTEEVTVLHWDPMNPDTEIGMGKTEEELQQTGVLIEDSEVPTPGPPDPGKEMTLYYSPDTSTLRYQQKDIPEDPVVTELKKQNQILGEELVATRLKLMEEQREKATLGTDLVEEKLKVIKLRKDTPNN